MVKFIKNFGLGLVYFLALPILLIAVVGYLVVGIGWWLFYVGKGLVRFFRGESFFQDLPEDIEVRRIKAKMAEASANPNPAPAPAPTPNVTTNTTNTTDSSQTYHVTNNFFGATPGMPGMGGIQTPTIGQNQPAPERIEMDANTIDLTTQDPTPSYQQIPTNGPQQQIPQQPTPMIGTSDNKFAEFDNIDLSLDEEDFK